MKRTGQMSLTASLDLMCCGFGAAVLLFLLTVMANSTDPVVELKETLVANTDVLVVRCTVTSKNQRAELGIEFLRPRDRGNEDNWNSGVKFDHEQVEFFTVPVDPLDQSDGASPGEAFLVINQPERGSWRFRPYLLDYPRVDKSNGQESGMSSSVAVRLEIFGLGSRDMEIKRGLELPGEEGADLEVFVIDD